MSSESPVSDDQTDHDAAPGPGRQIDDGWVGEHYARIHRAAWLMTGQAAEAEDLAQETFVVALDRWDSFEGRSSDSTWLYGILVRLVQRRSRTLARTRRRWIEYAQRNGLFQQSGAQPEDPQAELARRQWRESIWADVARLPPAQRIAVTLRYAEEMSYQRIAETVGCAEGTAKSRVRLGLKRLRKSWRGAAMDAESGDGQLAEKEIARPAFREGRAKNLNKTINTASDL